MNIFDKMEINIVKVFLCFYSEVVALREAKGSG